MGHFNRILALASLAITSPFAFAFDSVGVFYKPDKVLVQINEAGSSSRLKSFMDLFGTENDLSKMTEDESFKIECGRSPSAATCIFRFLPTSNNVRLFKRGAEGHVRMVRANPSQGQTFWFENSNGDRFQIQVKGDEISFRGNKWP